MRLNGDDRARPPGYREHGESHPRSTVSFKTADFRHDAQFARVCLSKGRNLKEHRSDFILCEYQTRPDVDLTEWGIQHVRAVYNRNDWRLQFVCHTTIDLEPPGDEVADVDLRICNFATARLAVKSCCTSVANSRKTNTILRRRKPNVKILRLMKRLVLTGCKLVAGHTSCTHSRKRSVAECVERCVRTRVVGDLGGIRKDDESGTSRNWGDHGNLELHGWAFDRFTKLLDYKAEAESIDVKLVSERDSRSRVRRATTRTIISVLNAGCTSVRRRHGDKRGLERCGEHPAKATPDSTTDGSDRDNGWLAQPAVHLFDRRGSFRPTRTGC